jgi:phosphopantetheine--protein transferase-like protein
VTVFGDRRAEGPVAPPFTLPDAGPCRFTAEELYRDQWLFHGPALRALVRVGASSPGGIEGTLHVLPRSALVREGAPARLLTDPIALDAFTHLLGCWGLDKCAEGDVMFPLCMAELAIFTPDPPEGSEVACRIAIRDVEHHRVRVGAELVAADGRVWMRLSGWEDWRFYWPARYRDVFRAPEQVFVGEPLPLGGIDAPSAVAVWVEPPADMGRPVWRDVLEWIQCGPEEREALRALPGPERRKTLRLWGRIAAKESARRIWAARGEPPTYPADLAVSPDERGRPRLISPIDPDAELPAVSIAHAEGVAVALAAADPRARVGIDVERIAGRDEGFEAAAFSEAERAILDRIAGASREEWLVRLWCAKEAAAKVTGLGMVHGPRSVEVIEADMTTGEVRVRLGPTLAAAFPVLGDWPIRVSTSRRADYVWGWTLVGGHRDG